LSFDKLAFLIDREVTSPGEISDLLYPRSSGKEEEGSRLGLAMSECGCSTVAVLVLLGFEQCVCVAFHTSPRVQASTSLRTATFTAKFLSLRLFDFDNIPATPVELARVIPRDVDYIIEGGNSTTIDNIRHGEVVVRCFERGGRVERVNHENSNIVHQICKVQAYSGGHYKVGSSTHIASKDPTAQPSTPIISTPIPPVSLCGESKFQS